MGGVQRYTQDGSHGTPDGFGDEFVHATGESGAFTDCSSRERERENQATGILRVDGTPDLRPMDLEFPNRQKRTPTAQTCTEPIYGNETMVNKHGKPLQWWLTMTAEENLEYWISNC